jgi:hypothetical protein
MKLVEIRFKAADRRFFAYLNAQSAKHGKDRSLWPQAAQDKLLDLSAKLDAALVAVGSHEQAWGLT